MKAFTVDWDEASSNRLALLYQSVADPNTIWPAQYRADRILEQRPRQAGTELSEGLWQLVEPPL